MATAALFALPLVSCVTPNDFDTGPTTAPKLLYLVSAAPDIDTTSFLQLAQKAAPHVHRMTSPA